MKTTFKRILLFTLLIFVLISTAGCAKKIGDPTQISITAQLARVDGGQNALITIANNSLHNIKDVSYAVTVYSEGGSTLHRATYKYGDAIASGAAAEVDLPLDMTNAHSVKVSIRELTFFESGGVEVRYNAPGSMAALVLAIVGGAVLVFCGALFGVNFILKTDEMNCAVIAAASLGVPIFVGGLISYFTGGTLLALTIATFVLASILFSLELTVLDGIPNSRNTGIEKIKNTIWVIAAVLIVAVLVLFALYLKSYTLAVVGIGVVLIAALLFMFTYVAVDDYEYTASRVLYFIFIPVATAGVSVLLYSFTSDILISLGIAALAASLAAVFFAYTDVGAPLVIISSSIWAAGGTALLTVAWWHNIFLMLASLCCALVVLGTMMFVVRLFNKYASDEAQAAGIPLALGGALGLFTFLPLALAPSNLILLSILLFGGALVSAALFLAFMIYEWHLTPRERIFSGATGRWIKDRKVTPEASKSMLISSVIAFSLSFVAAIILLVIGILF